MSQVITSRFPSQGPLNYYLIKRCFQAVTCKAGGIIATELEKCLLPTLFCRETGHVERTPLPCFWRISCAKQLLFLALSSLGRQMGQFTGVLWIRSVCSSDYFWSHSVGLAASWRLPTHARATGSRKSWQPASWDWFILSALDAWLLTFLYRYYHLSFPFYISGNWGSWGGMVCALPKATQLT